MKAIPLLTANDIECRIQSVSKGKSGKVGAILLIYKDARVDMRILDEVYGPNNWQRTHEVINGNLFCNIDIWDEDKKCWIRKQDVGVESNTEAEKGQASDAFKRASFCVGIGRELYSAPFIWIELHDKEYLIDEKTGKPKASPMLKFCVAEIGYDDKRCINRLVICDKKGNVRYTMGGKPTPKTSKPTGDIVYVCSDCDKVITPDMTSLTRNGKHASMQTHIDRCLGRWGVPLCSDCAEMRLHVERLKAEKVGAEAPVSAS